MPFVEPLDYPGERLARAGLLVRDRLRAWTGGPDLDRMLRAERATPLAARTLVVAVGSNASPDVVRDKLARAGADTVVPFVTGTLAGVTVAHSAHVSVPGYVPWAPAASTGSLTRVVAAHLDADQLTALDATEPNYQRRLLHPGRHQLVLDDGERPATFCLYDSRHGVLRPGGRLLAALPQADLQEWLLADPELAAILVGATPEHRLAVLQRAEVRETVRRVFAERGWATPSGLA